VEWIGIVFVLFVNCLAHLGRTGVSIGTGGGAALTPALTISLTRDPRD
jgi:hypothetical protein